MEFSTVGRVAAVEISVGRPQSIFVLSLTHRLRYMREERATPLLRLSSPVRETSEPECRAAGCTLFPKRILRCRLVRQPDSTIRLSRRQGPAPVGKEHKADIVSEIPVSCLLEFAA